MDPPEATLASPNPTSNPRTRSQSSPLTPPASGLTLTKTGRLSKARGSIPGSAADFRRREANRLAADRSRSRQAEKGAALENAATLLGEENARLKEQIAALEESAGVGSAGAGTGEGAVVNVEDRVGQENSELAQGHGSTPGPSRDSETHPQAPVHHPDSPSHRAAAAATAASDADAEDDVPTQEQQEAHSHTILAALTDITGVDFGEGNDASWMQGMESFLKENDTSGRLGELAAVAAHEEGDTAPGTTSGAPQGGERQLNAHAMPAAGAAAHVTALVHMHAKLGSQIPLGHIHGQGPSPGSNAATVLAAALNTEIERMVMEDLAMTKAGVVKLDGMIIRLHAGEMPADAELAVQAACEGLPLNVLSDEDEVLRASMEDVQSETARVLGELPGLKDELVKLRDEKAGEEDRIVALVREIRALGMESVEEEKDKMVAALKSIGGFVESLLNDDHPDSQFITGSYSSPALARRRRGRPPKGEISRTFYQNFLINTPNASQATGESADPKGKGKLIKKTRRSRLSQARDAELASAQPGGSVPGQAVEQVQEDDPNIDPALRSARHEDEHHEREADAETTAEAVNRAEAFILSHLNAPHASSSPNHPAHEHEQGHVHNHGNGHGHGHDERHEGMALDSTNFADFLPAQEALERQAGAGGSRGVDDDAFMTNQTQGSGRHNPAGHGAAGEGEGDAGAATLEEVDVLGHESGDHALGEGVPTDEVTPSVLSRLKQGPPGSCDICMRTETTVWRKLVLGGVDHKVCNACGLYHAKFGVIRPPELWGDGKSLKKRRSNQRSTNVTSSNLVSGAEGIPGDAHDEVGPSRKRQRRGAEAHGDHETGFAQLDILEETGEQHLGQYMLDEAPGGEPEGVPGGEQGGVVQVGEGAPGMGIDGVQPDDGEAGGHGPEPRDSSVRGV